MPRYVDPESAKGNLRPPGERVGGEPIEYAPPVLETYPFCPYSAEQIIAAHRQRNAWRAAPAPRIAPFRHHRSLRRI